MSREHLAPGTFQQYDFFGILLWIEPSSPKIIRSLIWAFDRADFNAPSPDKGLFTDSLLDMGYHESTKDTSCQP